MVATAAIFPKLVTRHRVLPFMIMPTAIATSIVLPRIATGMVAIVVISPRGVT
jgi:hypothetical protein